MPRIQWTGLPPALRDHLFDRLRERKITADDLYQLKTWSESDPRMAEEEITHSGTVPHQKLMNEARDYCPPCQSATSPSSLNGCIARGPRTLKRWNRSVAMMSKPLG